MTLNEIAQLFNVSLDIDDTDITEFSIDSRTIKPNSIYIAIIGERYDGHDFVEEAYQKGALGAIVSKKLPLEIPQIQCDDTTKAFGLIAKAHRDKFNIPFIGITGSVGKTTVKEMTSAIFKQMGKVHHTKGNLNNAYGTPMTLLELNSSHQYAVIELGANHPGEIAYSASLVKPSVALITNIAPAHTEGFGSLEGVANAKSELFEALTNDGIAILNLDTPHQDILKKAIGKRNVISYSLKPNADVYPTDIQQNEDVCYTFLLHTPIGTTSVALPIPGEHSISNALGASAIALSLKVPLDKIKKGLETIKNVTGRMNIFKSTTGATIIDDTYNANPVSVSAAIDYLEKLPGIRFLIFGDMGELGENKVLYHKEIGQKANNAKLDGLFTYGTLSKHTHQVFEGDKKHFDNHDALIKTLKPMINQNHTILIKGSRATEMEKISQALI